MTAITAEVNRSPVSEDGKKVAFFVSTQEMGSPRVKLFAEPKTDALVRSNGSRRIELQRQHSAFDELPSKVIGNYEIMQGDENILGSGSFGTVVRGRDVGNGKMVAIKAILTEDVKSQEIELVRRLKNPFIIHYLAVLKWEDLTYIAMELCDQDLGKFLETHEKLTHENASLVSRQVAQGYLALSHSAIVHRDIKPQNLLLMVRSDVTTDEPRRKTSLLAKARKLSRPHSPSETDSLKSRQPRIQKVMLSDFGLSRETWGADADEMANLAGTPFYMAPEVGANLLNRSDYDGGVDMWSIGVVLFQVTSGHVPFEEGALCKLFLRATNCDYCGYTAPEPEDGPEKLVTVIPRLLQIDPLLRLKPGMFHDFLIYDHPLRSIKEMSEANGNRKHSEKNILNNRSRKSMASEKSSDVLDRNSVMRFDLCHQTASCVGNLCDFLRFLLCCVACKSTK